MKTREELYNSIINGDNRELTEKWQKAISLKKKYNNVSLIICIIIDILVIYLISQNTAINIINSIDINSIFIISMMYIVPLLIIDGIIFTIISFFGKGQSEYGMAYKKNIIEKIIGNFYNNLEYFPEKEIPEKIYNEVNYEGYDIYYSEDYFEAKINGKYDIEMAEVETQKEETYKDSDGNTKTRTVTVFQGLFAKIVIDKSINSNLEIRR